MQESQDLPHGNCYRSPLRNYLLWVTLTPTVTDMLPRFVGHDFRMGEGCRCQIFGRHMKHHETQSAVFKRFCTCSSTSILKNQPLKTEGDDLTSWATFVPTTLSQYQRQACHSPMKSEMNGCARCHGPWALGCLLCHRVDHDVWTTGRGTQRRAHSCGTVEELSRVQWSVALMPKKTEEKFPQKGLKAKIDFRSPIFDTVLVLSFLGPVSSFHAHNEGLAYLLSRCLEWPIFVWESRYGMSPNWFGQQKTKSFRRMFTFFGRLPCF